MAIIPRRESQQTINTVSPTVRVSPDVASMSGRLTQKIGKQMQEVAEKFEKAKILEESTKADTSATIALRELEMEALEDQDVWNITKYQDRINEIKNETSKNITTQEARDKFDISFQADSVTTDFNVRRILRKKQIDSMRGTMTGRLDSLKNQYIGASSGLEQKKLKFDKNKLLDDYVESGAISREYAAKKKIQTRDEWELSSARNAIDADASSAKAMLERGDFKDLSEGDRKEFIKIANKKIENNKKAAKDIIKITQSSNLANAWINKEGISTGKIIEQIANGEIDAKEGRDIIEWRRSKDDSSPFGQYKNDKKIWMGIAEDSLGSDLDLNDFTKRINQAVSSGKMTSIDGKKFMVWTQSMYDKATNFKTQPNKFNMLVSSALKGYNSWAKIVTEGPEDALTTVYSMTKELFKKAEEGKLREDNIEEEANKIMEDTKKVINPNRAQFQIDQIVDTPAGQRRVVGFDVDGEPLVERVK